MNSINDKLERVRKPRVHIKYNVETQGAEVETELPFTVGVLGDYAGNAPTVEQKPLKDRKFVQIDRDNFDKVMQSIGPGVSIQVDNMLDNAQSQIALDLQFNRLEDFEPENVIEQVDVLKKLKLARDRLRDLLSKADRSDELELLLEKVISDDAALKQLQIELDGKGEG